MSSNTKNLGLLKKDPGTDGAETFNIKTMMNDNWDKIDAAVPGVGVKDAPAGTDHMFLYDNAAAGKPKKVLLSKLVELWKKTFYTKEDTDSLLSKKVPRSGELVPLGTNILTLGPGRYSVDGVTGDIWVQMNLPVLTWHYEIVVFAAEDYEGLENNHQKLITALISYNKECIDSYINEMSYDGTWTGWVKNATATPPQEFDLPITDSYDGTLYHRKYCKTQEGIIFCVSQFARKLDMLKRGMSLVFCRTDTDQAEM